MKLQKNDFVEIEFTGRVKDGEIFDSNIKKDLEEFHKDHNHVVEAKPFIFCLGQDMFLSAIEDFLIDKEIEKEYKIELPPEKAFGKRNPQLIQRIPLKTFKSQNLKPIPGFAFNFDGKVGKVLASSGGRVIVDFNNPIAGKDVIYKVKVLRKIEDLSEKAKALIKFLFRQDIKFEIKDKKIKLDAEKQFIEFIKMFKDKFKEILGLELEIEESHKKPDNQEKSDKPGKKES